MASLHLEPSTIISETSLRYLLETVFNTFVGKRDRETRISGYRDAGVNSDKTVLVHFEEVSTRALGQGLSGCGLWEPLNVV